jgi:hypothetical protein
MKAPGTKDQLLMEQKIPVTYLALEESLNYILRKLKNKSRNPVLNTSNYLKGFLKVFLKSICIKI